jgi:hypothetical protein
MVCRLSRPTASRQFFAQLIEDSQLPLGTLWLPNHRAGSSVTSALPPAHTSAQISALRNDDVYHPRHTELVGAHAEQVAPHLLLKGHCHGATIGKLVPVAA